MTKKRHSNILHTLISLAILLFLWQMLSMTGLFGRYSPEMVALILPSPGDIFRTFFEMLRSGELLKHLGVSLYRVGAGFVTAALIGVPMGIAMAVFPRIYKYFTPFVRIFQPIPGIAWIPMAIIWFGIGNQAAIFIITLGSLFPIILNTLQGMEDVDRDLVQAAQTLGAGRQVIFFKVILPSLIPYLLTGFRLAIGFGWRGVIAAEMVGVGNGLGYLLSYGRGIGRTDYTIVTMVSLAIIMLILEQLLFGPAEQKTWHWRRGWRS